MVDVLIALVALVTAAMIAVAAWSAIQNRRLPVRRVRAVALRRRTADYSIEAPRNPFFLLVNALSWRPFGRDLGARRISNRHLARVSGEVTVASMMNCFITFRAEGREIELLVPERVFMTVEDGTWGLLVYQGEAFKHFIPDPRARGQPGAAPERPLDRV